MALLSGRLAAQWQRANYVLVSGKAEPHPEGFYSIEWYENGKRRRQAVGKEASAAQAALGRECATLRCATSVGMT